MYLINTISFNPENKPARLLFDLLPPNPDILLWKILNMQKSWKNFFMNIHRLTTQILQWTFCHTCLWTSLVAQLVKNLPAMQETWVRSLGWEDPLEKGMATHSSILAWRISWTIHGVACLLYHTLSICSSCYICQSTLFLVHLKVRTNIFSVFILQIHKVLERLNILQKATWQSGRNSI